MKPAILNKRIWQLKLDIKNNLDLIDYIYFLGKEPSRALIDSTDEMIAKLHKMEKTIKGVK